MQEKWTPKSASKGKREKAKQIIEIAKKYNIPTSFSPEIIEIILEQDIGSLIPEEIFSIIAEIHTFIYQLEGRKNE
ncbi:MAG: EscU/YscU/HrcU family type III secretion system export apparatus switch protein [Calditrichia bacterium]|nr:EscU/YscU/HrcU family type III secretion system export apparatus switch protein [Calditrichia bacterium]